MASRKRGACCGPVVSSAPSLGEAASSLRQRRFGPDALMNMVLRRPRSNHGSPGRAAQYAEKVETLLRASGFETIRAWADNLVTVIGLEHLLLLKTRMGSEKARFDSLDETAREHCVESARQRLQSLTPTDFTATAQIVYALAS